MPNIPCPTKPCCPPDDNPLTFTDSNRTDSEIFVGTAWGANLYLPVTDCQLYPCFDIEESTLDQDDADLMAQAQMFACQYGSNNTFFNTLQVCPLGCPDGSVFHQPVNPGTFAANNQLLADRLAFTYACKLAKKTIVCLSGIDLSEVCMGTGCEASVRATVKSNTRITFDVSAGFIPPGLIAHQTSSNTFSLIGTVTQAGAWTFTIRATTQKGGFTEKDYTIFVAEITTASLPNAKNTFFYDQTLGSSGTSSTPTWTIASGSLPSGISLNGVTGRISGTASGSGTSNFTVAMTDGVVQCEKSFSITTDASNLVLWWYFDPDSGTGLLTDRTTLQDADGTAAVVGGFPQFPTGRTGYVGDLGFQTEINVGAAGNINGFTAAHHLTQFPTGTAAFTISFWFKLTDTTQAQRDLYLFGLGDDTQDGKAFEVILHWVVGTTFQLGLRSGPVNPAPPRGVVFYNWTPDTAWHNITAVCIGGAGNFVSNSKFYLDGVLLTEQSHNDGPSAINLLPSAQYYCVVGMKAFPPVGATQPPSATFDDCKVFTIALSPAQVLSLFHS